MVTRVKHTYDFVIPTPDESKSFDELREGLSALAEFDYTSAADARFGEGTWEATDFTFGPELEEGFLSSYQDEESGEWMSYVPYYYRGSVNIWVDSVDEGGDR